MKPLEGRTNDTTTTAALGLRGFLAAPYYISKQHRGCVIVRNSNSQAYESCVQIQPGYF